MPKLPASKAMPKHPAKEPPAKARPDNSQDLVGAPPEVPFYPSERQVGSVWDLLGDPFTRR